MSLLDRARAPVAALIAADVLLILANGRAQISNDTWLNLVAGREIAESGLIRTNSLTVLARGTPVCDPQWLAHLAWYGLHHVGGFAALLLVRAALSALTVALACTMAIRGGATPGRTALAGVLVLPLITTNAAVRAQSFGELCFVGVLWLLHRDQRTPSAHTWLVVPLTALWTNLHGSVLLGVAIAALVAPSRWVDRRRGRTSGASIARDLVLALSIACAVFASPYAASLPAYFGSTVGNASFGMYVTEYRGPSLTTEPWVFVIAAVALVVIARARRSMAMFDIASSIALMVLAFSGIRFGVFLAFGLLLILPRALDAALAPGFLALEHPRGVRTIAAMIALAAVLVGVRAARTLDGAIARDFPPRTAAEISRYAGQSGLVFASENYADTLLWYRPELRGRVALDARLDVLSAQQLAWEAALQSGRSVARLEPYSVVAVDKSFWPALTRSLSRSSEWRAVAEDPAVLVFVRD